MNKKMLLGFLVILLVLSTLIVGCSGVRGGGWFLDDDTDQKVTFSINLTPLDTNGNWTDVKGTIQLNDPSQNVSVHGISKSSNPVFYCNSYYEDFYAYDVKLNGKEGYWLYIWRYTYEEEVWYFIGVFKNQGPQLYHWWTLESEIQGHIKY